MVTVRMVSFSPLDPITGQLYLPAADFQADAVGEAQFVPGSFRILGGRAAIDAGHERHARELAVRTTTQRA